MTRSIGIAVLLLLAALPACGDRYPAPALASSTAPLIRVLLGKERSAARVRLPAAGWEVEGLAGRPFAWRGATEMVTKLTAGPAGVALDGRDTGATVLRIRPLGAFATEEGAYAGALVVRREGSRVLLVNEVDLETYVAGVVANELAPGAMPPTFRAQAVAARTYAWIKIRDPDLADGSYHVYDSDRSQVYKGLTVPEVFGGRLSVEDVVRWVGETRGVILTFDGRPFRCWYSSTCGGHTTDAWTGLQEPDAAIEPLRGVPCRFCATSPRFTWDVEVSDADLLAGFAKDRRPLALPIHSIEVTERGRGGWARTVRVTYGPEARTKDVPGAVFRRLAKLLSHRIDAITRTAGGWRVQGGGWGHGVGMCQWGAIEMGRQGFTETDILRYYYPGVSFTKVY